jgi:hypothetical protein
MLMTMGGKDAGGFQRGGDGFAFLDAFMDGGDGVADDDVAGGFLDDGQGLQNGHAAADQRAQSAGEAGDGHFADDRAEHRHDQFEFVPEPRPNLVRMKMLKMMTTERMTAGAPDVVLDGSLMPRTKR